MEGHQAGAERLQCQLRQKGICANMDSRKETLGGRVRLAQLQKIPYTAVIGEREEEQDQVAVRSGSCNEIRRLATCDWIAELEREIEMKALGGKVLQR